MIVISGALVLVSIVLLLIGIFAETLPFVYLSLLVTVVAIGALGFGVLQGRRSAASADSAPTGDLLEPSSALAASADETAALPSSAGSVLVVAGRPRYHVAGCRYLNGKDSDSVAVATAQRDGFTPCGVCKPDEALAAAGTPAVEEPVESTPSSPVEELSAPTVEAPVVEPTPEVAAAAGGRSSAKSGARKAAPAARTTTRVVKATPATKAAAKKAAPKKADAPAKASPAKKAAPAKASPAKKAAPAKASPAKKAAPAKASPAKKAAPATAGSVTVLPDADKFHQADCRYVRDDADAKTVTRAQAARQGFKACGVCKP